MKNKSKFLFVLTFAIIFLFYRVDSVDAMENIQHGTFDEQTDLNAEPGQNAEPTTEQEAEQPAEPTLEQEAEQPSEPALEQEAEQPSEPILEQEAEQPTEPAEQEADSVTTGTALIEWLESHKTTGGTVRLADNVVVEGYYSFCPDGPNMPSVFVDTDKYTITVTGVMELLSDDHLIFSGQPDGRDLFYVAEKGMLSMQGVAVESGQCALWQEEGAGLVVSSCHITGDIHYADTPYVMYYNDCICAIVENGQTANDVLPAWINCTVNREGQLSCDEKVPVSWDLEGTEEQQEERQRFQVQGSFLDAASAEPALCTVVYNDHPLTFTDVRASASGCLYTFQGGYTISEEYLPITVMAEYSFDGENWIMYEEQRATDTDAGFYIALKSDQDNTALDIYIRLQWNDNGTSYFSNVLCYAAADLKHVSDIGGGRGGGTSITNPPAIPQESAGNVSPGEAGAAQDVNNNADPNKVQLEIPAEEISSEEILSEEIPSKGISSNGNQTENGNGNIGADAAGDEQSSGAEDANIDKGGSFSFYSELPDNNESESFSFYSEAADTNEGQPADAGSKEINAEQSSCLEAETENDAGNVNNPEKNDPDKKESIDSSDPDAAEKEEETAEKEEKAAAAASVYIENSAGFSQIKEQTPNSDIRANDLIVVAAGFVLLSAIAGIAGFCVHSRSGTNR